MAQKTVLISIYTERQDCIYYKCFQLETIHANGHFYVEDDINVDIVDFGRGDLALRQLKNRQKEMEGCTKIYPSETPLLEHVCKDLLEDFDGTLTRMG